jgi:O-methyltransferase
VSLTTRDLVRRRVGRALRKPYYRFWQAVEAYLYRGREYSLAVPSGRLVYTPWFGGSDSEYGEVMCAVQRGGPVTVTPERAYMLYQFCGFVRNVPGEIAECGTFTGGTAHLIAQTIRVQRSPHRRALHLFDTFSGMPDFVRPERDHHVAGDFGKTSLELVQQRLTEFDFVRFHAGVIPDTFSEVETVGPYALVHLDVDIYPTMHDCCRWFWPRLSPGGAIVFDDYGYRVYKRAARAAIDEYFADLDARPIVLPTGQAVAIKLPIN